MKDINNTLLKKLRKLSNKDLLTLGQAYKIENRSNSTNSFQTNYNTMLYELRIRRLLRE